MYSLRKVSAWATLALCAAALSGCTFLDSFVPKKGETTDVIDRQQNLTVNDFKDLNKIDKEKPKDGEPVITAELGAPPIPDVAEVLAAPRPPKVANTKLVTLAVTDDVPLRDVLFELGRLANVDIEVGSGLDTTGINLRATNRPFNEVIERIATLGKLRYSVNGNSIRVERDLPYIKTYSLDFLNIVRSTTAGYNVSTSILGSASSGGSGSSSSSSSSSSGSGGSSSSGTVGTSGTTSSISSTGESDMWSALEASINEIVASDPSGGNAASAAGGTQAASGASGAANSNSGGASGSVIINRQAGILSVNATEAQHDLIARFLALMSRNASAQVLIEAKIVEVRLSDQFLSGVNWNQIVGGIDPDYLRIGSYNGSIPNSSLSTAGNGSVAFGIKSNGLDVIIRATQRFGTTRTLSSPRLSATNNQQAVLTFATNQVFFKCTTSPATTVPGGSSGNTTIDASTTCEASSVPIGIILNILPAINLDTQEVTLNVRPTLTSVVGNVPDPVTPLSVYPVIQVRELDSIMKVNSGGVMVIGGLMQDSTNNESDGVPGIGEVPILGNIFKSRTEDTFKSELVIFIKATIINPDGSTHTTDRKVYDKFFTDPRPLFNK